MVIWKKLFDCLCIDMIMASNNPLQMILTSRDLLLSVGQKMTVTICGVKYTVAVLGWKDKEFILADAPKASGNYLRLASFTGIRVRFVKEGHVISFDTRIIMCHSQPPAYMLIEFPQFLGKDNMRKNERYKARIPVTYAKIGGPPAAATIYDLSLGGALIAHTSSLATGETIQIDAEWKELGVTLSKLESTVQNVRENIQGRGLNFSGVMFWNNSEQNKQSLQKIIDHLIKESRS